MSKYPHTDLIEAPAFHWHNVYADLLVIESVAPTDDAYDGEAIISAYVECFKRADDCYHWEILRGTELMERGWMGTLEEAQADAETNFDLWLSPKNS